MQLVVSPELTPADIEAIARGYESREEVASARLGAELDIPEMPDPERETLELLAWLIESERLDIKVALVDTDDGVGIYHEKFGLFEDPMGQIVAFSGSANESAGGLQANFEVVDVFRSWERADRERVIVKSKEFEQLWNGVTPFLSVFEFPEAARERLLQCRPPVGRKPVLYERLQESRSHRLKSSDPFRDPKKPKGLVLRRYQDEAVKAWLGSGGKGIWEMATGTGKTVSALAAIQHVASEARKRREPLIVVISCPFANLVEQWAKEVNNFGVQALCAYQQSDRWAPQLAEMVNGLRASESGCLVVIATNASVAGQRFQEIIALWNGAFVFLADEVHSFGAPGLSESVPENANYRLGLSATPDRWQDDEGNQRIESNFGPILFSYSLAEAVRDDVLCPYRYVPTIVSLEEDERDEYLRLSALIAAFMAQCDGRESLFSDESESQELKNLLFRRARLIGAARAKIPALIDAIRPFSGDPYSLVYCSDGTMMSGSDGLLRDEDKQLNQVVSRLGNELGIRAAAYTAREGLAERRERMEGFAEKQIQCLVAMRCLDEGIDIPSIQRAFILASSRNPRQFIQRRGRVLRRSQGKDFAEIFDFLVLPPLEDISDHYQFETERRLAERELERAIEFAGTATNEFQALSVLRAVADRYNLSHLA
jgi:superfamily II DNA or RNA helicase